MLLDVVRPGALLLGKVIGVGLVGLAGLAAGAIPIVVRAIAGGDFPAGLGPAVAYGFAWVALGVASGPEIVASLVIEVVSVMIAVRLGAASYRRGIVQTGRRLHLREALRTP